MNKNEALGTIMPEWVENFIAHLQEQEKAPATIAAYTRALSALLSFLSGGTVTKTALISFKEDLSRRCAASTVNLYLAAVNGFLAYAGWEDFRVKPLKIQKTMFCDNSRELTRDEYARLVKAAENDGNCRLSLILQTICATGIRVSELRFITIEAARIGRAEVDNKGKHRTVLLPKQLCVLLLRYAKQQNRTAGPVFLTRTGRPIDRSNIWRDMKALCERAGVAPGKVFPHNLRHLFARTYYTLEKDLSRLADLLGHTSINTTRIYTIENGAVHARQIGRLGLVIT